MLRFSDDVKVNFKSENMGQGLYIEPMLLIPLVENAFKHGIGLIDQPVIDIHIGVSDTHELSVLVKNKFTDKDNESKDKNSGIGLNNLRKRLQLIYPGKFKLK